MADAIVAEVQFEFGGQQVYMPLKSDFINSLIVRQFNGDNIPELVRRFRISRSTVYGLINKARQAQRNEGQQIKFPGC